MVSGAGCRRKGHQFEREVAHQFAEIFGECRRGLQYRDGTDCADVITPCFWVECKRGKKTNTKSALSQAVTAQKGEPWKRSVAVCRDDGERATATMYLDDFLGLVKEWWELRQR